MPRNLFLPALLFILSMAAFVPGQSSRPAAQSPDYGLLMERAAAHETAALEDPVPFAFTERLNWSWGSETRSVIETAEGRADRIVLFRDAPLQPDQQQKQVRHLEKLLRDRDAVKDELQDQRAETQRRVRMMQAFPRALLFEFAGRENGLLRFAFRPNPEFSPKDRETQIYRGLEGTVWVEPKHERIVRIEGRLVKDVSFGWGILGKLNKGGVYEIGQTQVSPGIWRITTLNIDIKGRTFPLNGFRLFRQESNSQFHPTSPSTTYRDAVEALLMERTPLLGRSRR